MMSFCIAAGVAKTFAGTTVKKVRLRDPSPYRSEIWPDARIEQLKTLHLAGLSHSQIAAELGGTTKNAVSRKLHRLGLSLSREEVDKRRVKCNRARARVVLPCFKVVADEPLALCGADGAPITLLTVTDRQCHWPIGDPCDAGFHLCGHEKPAGPGTPYCPVHTRKAWAPGAKAKAAAQREQNHAETRAASVNRWLAA